ncbi:tRNA pseudouridine(55) synthase TruB [Aestuariibacter salexigens]|uniref:tRNA pseudouridine(55) synthase TruB n=1 Tax=Aestuariibacter salexigens TaxID=226010 RepID=UPI00041CC6AF|nr:tRNA pseudouridine(55) synthase TruB [Aestuariibacter salexigens]
MARRRKGRAINGIVLVDKPLGITSNDVVQKVKRAFFAAKAGHTGALDPLATGMLPVCLGEATKFSQFSLDADKTYQVTAKLGVRTTTSDADGEVVETHPVDVSETQLNKVLDAFTGPIKQVPSMFSALKHQGKPLYHYARQGITIEREARDITIFSLTLDRFEGDEVDLTVHCSKGTYIRSLVDDMGQKLGCGAYVTRLHRTHVAGYPELPMVSLEQIQRIVEQASDDEARYEALDSLLLAMDTAVLALPEKLLDEHQHKQFCHGQAVLVDDIDQANVQYRLYGQSPHGRRFLGIGESTAEQTINPKRLVVYPDA